MECTVRISGNFRCKNIFVVAISHENFIHEIIFTRVNSYYSQNLFAMLASYFARWPASLDSYLQPRDGLLQGLGIASKHGGGKCPIANRFVLYGHSIHGYLSVAFLGFHSRVLGQQLLPKVPDKRSSLTASPSYFFSPRVREVAVKFFSWVTQSTKIL